MTYDVTATADKEVTVKPANLAVASAVDDASISHDSIGRSTPSAKPATNIALEPVKRNKTAGEHTFDLATYGGAALIGNEAASLLITKSIEPGGLAANGYRKFSAWFESLSRFVNRDTGKPILSKYIVDKDAFKLGARLPFLLTATVGGMLMVPFVKALEDNKGKIVRKFDRMFHGTKADTDPELVSAHKEMDNAPKQSWSSLGWGRVTTVISAAIADYAFGWQHAISTKIFGTEYASLDGIAKKTASFAKKRFNMTEKGAGWVDQGTWLLTLSATLTIIFYATSKLFAKKRDERMERRTHGHDGVLRDDAVDGIEPEVSTQKANVAQPETKVSSVTYESMLSTREPQLAASH